MVNVISILLLTLFLSSPFISLSEEPSQKNNPFFFPSGMFESRLKSGEGHLLVLPRFTQESPFLRRIENYRLSILEANPSTFVVPHHSDSEAIFVVVSGKGTITLVNDKRRQSFNIERGNVIRVPAGITVYMVNPDTNEKLTMVALKQSLNAPGHYQEFFPTGLENSQAYYNVFCKQALEAVFNIPRDQLKRLFEGQRQSGMIRRASKEQLEALSEESSSSPSEQSEFPSPIMLIDGEPEYSSQNNHFYEIRPDEFKQLHDMAVSIAVLELQHGSIYLPQYNTKQTTIMIITQGTLRFEMACPQQGEEKEDSPSGQYRKITSDANPGDVFVIPAGHPVIMIASSNENVRAIGFGINAENNKRVFLAGQNNIVTKMESEAQELSFGVPAKLVEKVFGNQEESHFVSGTQQRQQRGEGRILRNGLSSMIMDFARLF